jgi:hypothetical protein
MKFFSWCTPFHYKELKIILVNFMAKTKTLAPPDLKIGPNKFEISMTETK